MDFAYWWSFSSGGSSINGVTPSSFRPSSLAQEQNSVYLLLDGLSHCMCLLGGWVYLGKLVSKWSSEPLCTRLNCPRGNILALELYMGKYTKSKIPYNKNKYSLVSIKILLKHAKNPTVSYKRHCKHLQQSQSHSVEIIFVPWLEKNSG